MENEELSLIFSECKNKITKITSIWKEIGVSGDKLKSRSDILKNRIFSNLEEMFMEEYQNKEHLIKSISNTTESLRKLSDNLCLEFELPVSENLIMQEKLLLQKKIELTSIKDNRLRRLNNLLEEEDELCQKLFHYKKNLIIDNIPSESQLKEMTDYVKYLNNLKDQRLKELTSYKMKIQELVKLLGRDFPNDQVLNSIMNDDMFERIPLSDETMKDYQRIINSLTEEIKLNKIKINDLKKSYNSLFKFLSGTCNLTYAEYADESYNVFTDDVFIKLEFDVDQLKLMRQEKMGQIIDSCKNRLCVVMDENLAGHLVKTEPYKSLLESTDNSETTLAYLENQIKSWEENEKYIGVLKLDLDNYFAAQEDIEMMENQLIDPEIRKNRGGIMLKIQKQLKERKVHVSNCKKSMKNHMPLIQNTDLPINELVYKDFPLLDLLSNIFQDDKENKNMRNAISTTKLGGPTMGCNISKNIIELLYMNEYF